MMRIEERGVVYRASDHPASERAACFTTLCQMASGTLLCGFHIGPSKHAPTSTIRLGRSRDAGRTWQVIPFKFQTTIEGIPGEISGSEMVEVEPGRLMLCTSWFDRSDPKRPFFDPVSEGILPGKLLCAFSTDEGETWGAWRTLPVGDLTGCGGCGPAFRWTDGRAVYPFESYKEYNDPRPGRHGAWMLITEDNGRSFEPPVLVAQDPANKIYYWDERLCPGAKPGDFFALFWTHDLSLKKDLNVHFRRGWGQGKGFRLGPIVETPIPGQIGSPLWLQDGRLFAFVVDRGRPATMTLWRSPDEGEHWSEHLVVYTHEEKSALATGAENVDFADYWDDMRKWSFGHPAVRDLGGGKLLLAYYAGDPNNMDIHWARVDVGAAVR